MWPCLLLVALVAVGVLPSRAIASAGAINLGWMDCGGLPPTFARTFACDTNSGSSTLVGSFIPLSERLTPMVGLEAVLDLRFDSARVPNWWQVLNPGSCRQDALSFALDYSGYDCEDPWTGTATGEISSYTPSSFSSARLRLSVRRPTPVPLIQGVEYFAFKLSLTYEKSAGDGACSGCRESACIFLSGVQVTADNDQSTWLCEPGPRNFVAWQHPRFCPPESHWPSECEAVPTLNRTWGAVKMLYR